MINVVGIIVLLVGDGNLHEASHLDTLVEGAALYHQTEDGLIPWRSRPEHFKRNCIARVPPLEDTHG